MGLDNSLLFQHMDDRMNSEDYMCTSDQALLDVILSADKAIHDMVTFSFAALHLLSAGRRN